MGYPENQKLAKDINKVNDECTDTLAEVLNNTLALLTSVKDTLSGISI